MLVAILPLASFGQGFSRLFDYDSTYEYGWHIFIEPSGNYSIFGEATKGNGPAFITNMEVAADGNNILSKHGLFIDTSQIYSTESGQAAKLPNGGYLLPVTIQSATTPVRSAGGLAKYNASGDTIFVRMYTDTSLYFDNANACALLPNGDYLLGSTHELYPSTNYPSRIIRTDSNGNIIWARSYQKVPSEATIINTIEPLGPDKILVGAMSHNAVLFPFGYVPRNYPWFLILDTAGNILKDTLFGDPYWGAGAIHIDPYGGFYHVGWIDSFPELTANSLVNGPSYIAHLDTNFQIEWITSFGFIDSAIGKRYISVGRQLQNSNFVLVGESYDDPFGWARGWTAEVSHSGTILWNHNYYLNPHHDNELWDIAERSNGSLILVGESFNDTLPTWRQQKDIWLLSVDSNGCIEGGCDNGLAVHTILQWPTIPRVYPNPTTGDFTLETVAENKGYFYLYTLLGQLVGSYPVKGSKTEIHMASAVAPGIYIGRFAPSDGSGEATVRIVYENQ